MTGRPNDHGNDSKSSSGSWLIEDIVETAIDTAAELAEGAMGLDTKK